MSNTGAKTKNDGQPHASRLHNDRVATQSLRRSHQERRAM